MVVETRLKTGKIKQKSISTTKQLQNNLKESKNVLITPHAHIQANRLAQILFYMKSKNVVSPAGSTAWFM